MKTHNRSGRRHILVIDDNESIHEDFRKILIKTKTDSSKLDDYETALFGSSTPPPDPPSYEVDSAFQGKEGLELVRQALHENRPYPMAFVDMRMPPGWDGLETIARIWEEYPDLQVVICTAYTDYSWEQMLQKLGRTDRVVFLKKPFDSLEVLQLVQTLTERWERGRQTRCQLCELEQTVKERTAELAATRAELREETAKRMQAEEQLQKARQGSHPPGE